MASTAESQSSTLSENFPKPAEILKGTHEVSEISQRSCDIVIFGVTGVTGQMVLEKALDRFQGSKIAVAGRSRSKVQSSVAQVAKLVPRHCEEVAKLTVVEANVADYSSLVNMCKQAKLVLNCVGPFRLYGEEVVKAAIESGTHYMDISGEPYFLELTESKWNESAKRTGVWILGSCAFDSIPSDLGVVHFRKQFPGELAAVEAYLSTDSGSEGYIISDGTWQSAIYGFVGQRELSRLRKSQNFDKILYAAPHLPNYGSYFKTEEVGGYCVPFAGSDRSVVLRTQRYQSSKQQLNPIRFKPYVSIGGFINLVLMVLCGSIFVLFVKYEWTRSLLEKYPWFFSFGKFRKGGPTRKQMEEASFRWTFKGLGYSSPSEMQSGVSPTVSATSVFKGPDAGYIGTSIMFLEAAQCVLKEPRKLPEFGGVYTPGVAFAETSLVERLQKCGFKIGLATEASAK